MALAPNRQQHSPVRDLDQIRRQFEALTEELIREEYLALSGLKETLEFEQVYTRYPGLVDSETLHVVLQALRAEPASTDRHRERRLLLDSLYTMRIVRDVAPAYEKVVQWRSNREIRLDDGREIPIGRAINEIARTEEQSVRSGIDDARARAVDAELSPLLIEGFRREKANVADLGLTPTYLETFELTKDVSLSKLKDATQAFLRDTSDEWEAVRRELVRERLRMDPATTTRADAFALFRVTDYDTFFPADALERTVFGQVGDLGLDPLAGGRIIVDTAVRKGKYPRAFCAPVRVPDEVYLVTCPTSGAPAEWGVLLHEMGHSLHYAYTDPALPIEYRRLGDMAVTEAYASLFDHLMHDARWLERHTPIGTRAREFVRLQTIEELYNVRRYCARFGYELELYEDNGDFAALPARYEAVMSEATAFRHRREDAFNDVDSRLYVLSYLRARQLRPVLEKALVDRFGRDWWANSSAGAWLVDTLFAQGNRETADEIALRLTGEPLSFAALQRSLLERLY